MKSRFTIEKKMYIFVAAVVLFAALGVATLSYMISSTQMERFDKRITRDSAKNYVSLTDVEYLKRLKAVVLSDEYQQLRDKAEESDDEELVISYLKEKGLDLKIEIEVRSFDEIRRVMACGGVDRIMLDNFSVEDTRKAVEMIGGKYETESSGGITYDTMRPYAECGVDFISVGALTHSVKGLDMSFKAC